MSTISKSTVEHVAVLCSLTLSEKEKERLESMLSETVDFIGVLEELDTNSVPETYQVIGTTNVFQKSDRVSVSLDRKEALSNAAKIKNGKFVTGAVFDR